MYADRRPTSLTPSVAVAGSGRMVVVQRGSGSGSSRTSLTGSDPIEDRPSSGRDGEGPEPSPSTALRAGSASKAAGSGGLPNASHPSNSGATHPLVQAFLPKCVRADFGRGSQVSVNGQLGRPAESAERGQARASPLARLPRVRAWLAALVIVATLY